MWVSQTIELGSILENSTHKVKFRLLSPITIDKMESACRCTEPIYNKETQTIDVEYKAGKVPKHLRYKGSFLVKKVIKVFTPTKRYDLEIRATIKMPYFYDR